MHGFNTLDFSPFAKTVPGTSMNERAANPKTAVVNFLPTILSPPHVILDSRKDLLLTAAYCKIEKSQSKA